MPEFLYRIQPVRPETSTVGFTERKKQLISEHFEYFKHLAEAEQSYLRDELRILTAIV
jgi:hypothetical protein